MKTTISCYKISIFLLKIPKIIPEGESQNKYIFRKKLKKEHLIPET